MIQAFQTTFILKTHCSLLSNGIFVKGLVKNNKTRITVREQVLLAMNAHHHINIKGTPNPPQKDKAKTFNYFNIVLEFASPIFLKDIKHIHVDFRYSQKQRQFCYQNVLMKNQFT